MVANIPSAFHRAVGQRDGASRFAVTGFRSEVVADGIFAQHDPPLLPAREDDWRVRSLHQPSDFDHFTTITERNRGIIITITRFYFRVPRKGFYL